MSRLFYDNFIKLKRLDKKIKHITKTQDEKEELWVLIDELIHYRVLGCILDKLSKNSHEEFLSRFYLAPYDEDLIDFLNKMVKEDIVKIIKKEIKLLEDELIKDIKKKLK